MANKKQPATHVEERFIRLPEVKAITGAGHSKIYRDIQQGLFPAPYHMGKTAIWFLPEIKNWMAQVMSRGEASE